MASKSTEPVSLEVRDRVAIITLNRPKQLNAMTREHFYEIAKYLRQVADMESVVVTVVIGTGRFFSAGADVRSGGATKEGDDLRRIHLAGFVGNNIEIPSAFYQHPKILITALNGPAVGLSAACIAHSDFIYAAPHSYVLVPFTSLGLVSEGGAAKALVERMGIAKANEALIMSKRIECDELVQCGFVNKVIHAQPGEDEKFKEAVLHEIDERLGPHLVKSSMLEIKRQIRLFSRRQTDELVVDEVMVGLNRFAAGIPQEEFIKIATGKKRHKL